MRVSIQELENINIPAFTYTPDSIKSQWKYKKCKHRFMGATCNCVIRYYIETCQSVKDSSNPFYNAFCYAYNHHKDVILSPDDVWMMITLQFSKCVNDNAEAMRNVFVDHDGKKTLNVTTWSELSENEWSEFFKLIIKEITDNTKSNVVSMLQSDFTTSGETEIFMSTSIIMNTFKAYFDYGRCIPSCGITGVQFLGDLNDWKKLIIKTNALKELSKGFFDYYIDQILPILAEFKNTYEGNVNVDFWNSIMNFERKRLGSGSTTKVNGWITYFYGIYQSVEEVNLKNYYSDSEVLIDNKLLGYKKKVNILSGFSGVHYNGTGFRPQMSLAVYDSNVLL